MAKDKVKEQGGAKVLPLKSPVSKDSGSKDAKGQAKGIGPKAAQQPAKGKQVKATQLPVKGKESKVAKLLAKGNAKSAAKQSNKDAKDGKQPKGGAEPKRSSRIGRFFKRIGKYFREMFAELKKATWPSRKLLIKYTGIVLAFVSILAVVVGLLDLGFTTLLKLITG
jgi:preprotein translocase subunit SecE